MNDDAFHLSSENWPQVQHLLAKALEHAPGERTAFLRQACGRDLALYREIESLLRAYDEAGSFLDALDAAGVTALLADETDATVGTMVGPYHIVRTLGRGGMGVVYLAEDIRLNRSVALKFLPPNRAADNVAQQRLLAEAKAAAALDHPHIGVVHEIGETTDGQFFIAMAYYEGETLREKMTQGPLSVAETILLARQIADGLQAAHRRGIIHRDIKPSNILLTAHGSKPSEQRVAKIVDFGIARFLEAELTKTEAEATPGTIAYMSPEQTCGEAVDQQTDVWSLGVVMYEMLTGERPFQGKSDRTVIHAIRHDVPMPPSRLRSTLPPELEAIVHQCLIKDPKVRCPSMAEVIARLDDLPVDENGKKAMREHARPALSLMQNKYLVSFLGVLMLAVVVLVTSLVFAPSSPSPFTDPPRRVLLTSYPGFESEPAFSPDGNHIAFFWDGEDQRQRNWDIYTKQLGVGVDNPIRLTSHPDIDFGPVWSPDGQHIAFVRIDRTATDVGVYLIPALGGSEQKLATLWVPSMLSWSPDGTRLFFVDRDSAEARSAVYALSLETLERQKLTDPPVGAEDLEARISPDGKMLAVARGQRRTPVVENIQGDVVNVYTDLYVGELAALPGTPLRRLTSDRSTLNGLAWTPDSRTIIYASDRLQDYGNLRLWRVPAAGGPSEHIPTRGDRAIFPAVSPDGQLLVYTEGIRRRTSFWHYALSDTTGVQAPPERLIYSTARETSAEYSPDGQRIVFASQRSGNDEIWICDSDGSNPVRLTFLEGPRAGTPRWSPDGRFIVFDSWLGGGPRAHIYVIPSDGGTPRRITSDSLPGATPFWSQDGQWIYGGTTEGIFKFPVRGGRPLQVTTEGGDPRESPNGQWLYYWKQTDPLLAEIWRIPTTGGDAALVIDSFNTNPWGNWVVFDDGLYFMNRSDAQPTVSVNFFDLATEDTTLITYISDFYNYMHVSPDREHLLVRRSEGGSVDLVALENWRQTR